jgi:hypothetical protein
MAPMNAPRRKTPTKLPAGASSLLNRLAHARAAVEGLRLRAEMERYAMAALARGEAWAEIEQRLVDGEWCAECYAWAPAMSGRTRA